MFIEHEPQIPSRQDLRNVNDGSCSFLILIKASNTIIPHLNVKFMQSNSLFNKEILNNLFFLLVQINLVLFDIWFLVWLLGIPSVNSELFESWRVLGRRGSRCGSHTKLKHAKSVIKSK